MPNIDEYSAGNLGLQPSETGVESAAGAGRRIGAFENQTGEELKGLGQEFANAIRTVGTTVNQYEENREINTGAMHAATFALNKNQEWNDYITGKDIPDDPDNPNARQDAVNARINNTAVAKSWIETNLDPELEKFQEGFITEGGQKWAQGWADKYRDHAVTTALGDQSRMAGAVVVANLEKTGDTLAVDTFAHPANLGINFDLLDHSIKGNVGSSPTITPDVATRILQEHSTQEKEKLVQAALQGTISKGGDWKAIASDPRFAPYIKPGENEAFQKQQDFYQRSSTVAQKQEILLNKQIAETNMHSSLNDSWNKNVKINDDGSMTVNPQFTKDAAMIPFKHGDAPNAAEFAKTWVDWSESQLGKEVKHDNPDAVSGLLQAFSSPTFDPGAAKLNIAKAEIAKTVTSQTATQMRQLADDMIGLKDPILTNMLAGAKEIIESGPGGKKFDPGRYAAFYYNFIHNVYMPQRAAGTLPSNALDIDDPKSLISQKIKDAQGPRPLGNSIAGNGGVGAVTPSPPISAAAPSSGRAVNSKAEYDALPPGTDFTMNGKKYKKP